MVSFGDASLILSDITSNVAMTHWSLSAAERLNPGGLPAIFSPDPRGDERLEIADPIMVEAIDQVRRAIDSGRSSPGRLRAPLVGACVVILVVLAVLLLPGALMRHTAAALPPPTRVDIADKVLRDMARLTGKPCVSPAGDKALVRLRSQLSGETGGAILVLPRGFDTAAHLPDGRILIQNDLIEDQDSQEIIAGFIIAEDQRIAARDPMMPLLRAVGLPATLRLLTTGDLAESAVRGYAEVLLTAPVAALDQEQLLARFAEVGARSTPFAYALDSTGERTLGLIEGDPFRGQPLPPPLLADAEWVGLQGICAK